MSAATAEAPASKDAKPKGKYTFRILAGRHWKPEPVLDWEGKPVPKIGAGGKPIMDPKTRQPVYETKDVEYGPGSAMGDIVDSDERLDLKFNSPVSRKFELVGQDGLTDEMTEKLQRERQRSAKKDSYLKSALQRMDRQALASWAEEHGVDVGTAVKRDDLLRAILQAVEGEA